MHLSTLINTYQLSFTLANKRKFSKGALTSSSLPAAQQTNTNEQKYDKKSNNSHDCNEPNLFIYRIFWGFRNSRTFMKITQIAINTRHKKLYKLLEGKVVQSPVNITLCLTLAYHEVSRKFSKHLPVVTDCELSLRSDQSTLF